MWITEGSTEMYHAGSPGLIEHLDGVALLKDALGIP